MGKWMERLHGTTEDKIPISVNTSPTKPAIESAQVLLYPFVSANSKNIHFFSNSELPNNNQNNQVEKTVKASKQEVTKPTKGIAVAKDIKTTDHEVAEQLISSLELHDDQVFVRQCLIGIYGSDRLAVVQEYFNQWYVGSSSEPISHKKENAGRYRANVWIREEKFN